MKNIVIYFSRKGMNYVNGDIKDLSKGNTEYIAEYIQEAADADTFEVIRKEPYPLDYRECVEESVRELKQDTRPDLLRTLDDISEYDNVFVAGPCWCGHYPLPLASCLSNLDFKGKKVHFVMSHEGSGLAQGKNDIKSWCRNAEIGSSLAIHGTEAKTSKDMISVWAKKALEA